MRRGVGGIDGQINPIQACSTIWRLSLISGYQISISYKLQIDASHLLCLTDYPYISISTNRGSQASFLPTIYLLPSLDVFITLHHSVSYNIARATASEYLAFCITQSAHVAWYLKLKHLLLPLEFRLALPERYPVKLVDKS